MPDLFDQAQEMEALERQATSFRMRLHTHIPINEIEARTECLSGPRL
ncbi:MAG: hypothetical protein AB7E32_09765 [Desulfovibrio sp.]